MEKITKSSKSILIDPNEPLILPDGTALVGRIEWFLYALCCLDYQNLPTPMSRIEEFANALITGEIPNIEPQSRAEQFFLAILDGNVSNLPQPQSRSEVLLDKLARGEFDLSDVEPIQSSYELLLAYLIKNGGIDNIDYVLYEFSEAMKTMYNTVEKPFKSLELSGNTLVNCVLEDTENDDYVSFDQDYEGQSFTINGTSEGAIKSAILKGQTLVNIPTTTNRYTTNKDISGWVATFEDSTHLVKANTKYYVGIFNYSNESKTYGLRLDPFAVDTKITINSNGYGFLIGTTVENITSKALVINKASHTEDNNVEVLFIEYQQGMENWDIPYFEGMQSVKLPVLSTIGKNLFKPFRTYTTKGLTFTITGGQLYVDGTATDTVDYYLTTEGNDGGMYDFINNNIPIGATLTLSNNLGLRNHFGYYLDGVEKDCWANESLAIKSNTSNIRCFVRFPTGQSFSNQPLNIQLEQGAVATSYEPYKTNILSTSEEVVLRGIGDVKDTLNCNTGEMVERIGEIVYTGDEDWKSLTMAQTPDNIGFYLPLSNHLNNTNDTTMRGLVKDNLGFTNNCFSATINTPELNGKKGFSIHNNGNVYFTIPTSECANVSVWKNKLKEQPLVLQYAINPIVKTVDLNVVDQSNTKIDKIHVFDEVTHVNASSDELTPTVNIGKSVSYPTIIKPNTKYTVDLKRNDKPLTVNLGGTEVTFVDGETRKTITTPSTLTNDKLSYYGIGAKCNEIMLIEGEAKGNVDYFTGIQSVVMQNQMPILHSVNQMFDYSLVTTPVGSTNTSFSNDGRNLKVSFETNRNCFQSNIGTLPIGTYEVSYEIRGYVEGESVLNSRAGITFPNSSEAWWSTSTSVTKHFSSMSVGEYAKVTKTIVVSEPVTIVIIYHAWSDNAIGWCEFRNIRIVPQGKSSILSCNEEVELRGIGGVKDELNLITGGLTERIGEVVFDGSDDEKWRLDTLEPWTNGEYYTFSIHIQNAISNFNGLVPQTANSKYPDISYSQGRENGIGCFLYSGGGQAVAFRQKNITTLEDWKTHLQANPITVQYRLANESIKAVDLSVVDQNGNAIHKIKSYKDVTHLEVTVPKQSLLPNVSAEVATDNSKDMSSLAEKHQEISEVQSAIQNNIQSQSDEIDTAMMATTEIFESILE